MTPAPVAYLRDAHEGEGDECLVPAAMGDPGAFPVYTAEQLFDIGRNGRVRDVAAVAGHGGRLLR